MSSNKALLKKLEDTLLRELSNATGNILDNGELIATLECAKDKAVDISHKLAAAKATAREIEDARVRYSPVATRGAVLLFVMAGLSAVNNMYEYSLAAFLKVFKQVRVCSTRMGMAAGVCHEHQPHTASMLCPPPLPVVAGHEQARIEPRGTPGGHHWHADERRVQLHVPGPV
jgi:hypothetical protein